MRLNYFVFQQHLDLSKVQFLEILQAFSLTAQCIFPNCLACPCSGNQWSAGLPLQYHVFNCMLTKTIEKMTIM